MSGAAQQLEPKSKYVSESRGYKKCLKKLNKKRIRIEAKNIGNEHPIKNKYAGYSL